MAENESGSGQARQGAESFELKIGLAEMLKGGVIMDVTDVDQAKIAEDAGACAVMALERVPADIRRDGGVARMSAVDMIEGIQRSVSIPVMAKVRIGHIAEARVLESLGVDFDAKTRAYRDRHAAIIAQYIGVVEKTLADQRLAIVATRVVHLVVLLHEEVCRAGIHLDRCRKRHRAQRAVNRQFCVGRFG